jgi:hypothetical protein
VRLSLSCFSIFLAASPALAGGDGPDEFGYSWVDSNEADGPTYQWTEPQANHQIRRVEDDTLHTLDLPFIFTFYGEEYDQIWVCTNGFVGFVDPGECPFNAQRLPNNNSPHAMLASGWIDIYPLGGEDRGVFALQDADGAYVIIWKGPYFANRNGNGGNDIEAALRLQPDGISWESHFRQVNPTVDNLISVGAEDQLSRVGISAYADTIGQTVTEYAVAFEWAEQSENSDPEFEGLEDKSVFAETVLQFTTAAADADDDPLTFSVANLPQGATYNTQTGLFRWTPSADQVGDHLVTFTVQDDFNPPGSDTQTVTLTVMQANRPPVITSTPPEQANAGEQYVYQVVATDPDGDALTYILGRGAPAGASLNRISGLLTWTPGPGDSGELFDFRVFVRDENDSVATQFWQVGVDDAPPVNHAPTIDNTAPTTAVEGLQYVWQVEASDDDDDPIAFALRQCPNGASVDGRGRFTWTPPAGTAGETFDCTLVVNDGRGGVNAQRFTIAVQPEQPPPNEAPQFNTQPPTTAVANSMYVYVARATDPEGTDVRFSLSESPAGATVDAATGRVRWRPGVNQAGDSFGFTLVAEDEDGVQAEQSWTVTVADEPNNRPLVTSTPPGDAYADELYQYAVVATDPDGDALTFSLVNAPDGAAINRTTGLFTWTPSADDVGQIVNIRIRVRDDRGLGINHDWSVVVREGVPGNRDPVFGSSPSTQAVAGELYTYRPTVSDPDGDDVSLTLTIGPEGATLENGQVRWTPGEDRVGQTATFVLDASDGNGGTARQQFLVVVSEGAANTAPTFTSTPNTAASVDVLWSYNATWNDPDGDQVTFRMVSGPNGMQATADGQVRWTPQAADAGESHRVVLEVRDSHSAFRRQAFNVQVAEAPVNQPPRFTSEPASSATVDNLYSYSVEVTDADGDPITLTLVEAPAGARLAGTVLTWTPDAGDSGRQHAFRLRADDGNGGSVDQAWQVSVTDGGNNRAPSITSTPNTQATAGEEYTYQVTATDPDGDRLFFVLPEDQNPPEGMTIDVNTGVIRWTPGVELAGQAVLVTVAVVDEGELWDAQRYEIGIGVPANQPPAINSNWPTTAEVGVQYIYQVVASDPDGDVLRFFTDPENCPEGVSIHMLSGRLTWTPQPEHAGDTHTCLIGVVDPGDLVDTQTIDIRVADAPTNQPPVIVSQAITLAAEGEPYAYNVTASDPDGDELTYTLVSGPPGSRMVSQGPIRAVIWFVPPGSAGRSFDFVLRVSDGNGGTVEQAWTVNVTDEEVNRPPVITSSPGLQAGVGVLYQYAVRAFDLEGDTLSYALENAPPGATISEAGNIRWVPNVGQAGQQFSFHLIVSDSNDGAAAQEWVVSVSGEPPPPQNNPPVITSTARVTASVGQLYRYDAQATDPDGDPLFWVFPEDFEAPEGMQVNASTGEVTWTPGEAFGGETVRITLAVTDGTDWAAQVYDIAVDSGVPNRAPVFTSVPPRSATGGALFSYTPTAEDPDDDAIGYSIVNPEACPDGMTINSITGEVRWTPSVALIGQSVSCVIAVFDTGGLAATQALVLQVTDGAPANNAPQISTQPLERAVAELTYRYEPRATDLDGDPLSWRMTAGPLNALFDPQSGTIVWTPSDEDVGQTVAFAIEVSDGRGGVNRQQWEVVVEAGSPVNEPPVIVSNPSSQAQVGQLYSYPASAQDPDGDSLTWRVLEAPTGVQINASTGALTWVPNAQQENQDHVFQIEVSDGNAVDRQRWTVRVREQVGGNNPPTITSRPGTTTNIDNEYRAGLAATDPDGDSLTWRLIAAPNGASLTSDGVLVWGLGVADIGRRVTFSVEVSDGRGGTDQLQWRVEVLNRAPVIESEPRLSATVGEAYSYTVSATDDDSGQALTYSLQSGAPRGMTIDGSSGEIQWIPGEQQTGQSFTVVVVVRDGAGGEDQQSFRIGVDAPAGNRAPSFTSRAPTSTTAGESFLYDAEASDPEGDALVYSLDPEGIPAGMSIDADSGVVRWNVPLGMAGEALQFTLIVRDADGLFDRQSVLLTVVAPETNQNPEFGGEPIVTGVVDVQYQFAPRASDPDGDPINVDLVRGPPGAICSDSRCNQLTWTPSQTGSFEFVLRAEDDQEGFAELRWSVDVSEPSANRAPSFVSLPGLSAVVDEEYVYRAIAGDPDGDELVYSLSALSPAAMRIEALTGQITWTPLLDDVGEHEVIVEVRDGRGGQDLQQYRLTVEDTGANRAPVVTSEALTTAEVDELYSYPIRAHDLDDDPLSYELKRGPAGMTVSDEGLVEWLVPASAAAQMIMVQVVVSDGEHETPHNWVIEVSEVIAEGPHADAGADRTVDPGMVRLDGSGSVDGQDRELTYSWVQIEGPVSVEVLDANAEVALVEMLNAGVYGFRLTVRAPDGVEDSDEVTLTVRYTGPIAVAGDDQRHQLAPDGAALTVRLDGSSSVFAPGETGEFGWTQMSGPTVSLSDASSAQPEFSVQDPGVYSFELTVSDAVLASAPDIVVVSIDAAEMDDPTNWGEPEGACGCSGGLAGGASYLLLGLVAGLGRRRRRRRL